MKKYLNFLAVLSAALVLIMMLYSCKNEKPSTIVISKHEIVLSGDTAACDADGVEINDGEVLITKSGVYSLKGNYNGSIAVDVDSNEAVTLTLNNVEINCLNNPAIYSKSGSIIINIPENTTNTLTDTSKSERAFNATLYTAGDMTLYGDGELTIVSQSQNAISSQNELLCEGGKINIDTDRFCIASYGKAVISGGNITIDGPSDNDSSILYYNSTFAINGGTFTSYSNSELLQAPSDICRQSVLIYKFAQSYPKNTAIYLLNDSDSVVAAFTSKRDFSSFIISTPLIEKSQKYTLYIVENANDKNEIIIGKPCDLGEKFDEIEMISTVTTKVYAKAGMDDSSSVPRTDSSEDTINRDPSKTQTDLIKKPDSNQSSSQIVKDSGNDSASTPKPDSSDTDGNKNTQSGDTIFPSEPDTAAGYGDNEVAMPSDW